MNDFKICVAIITRNRPESLKRCLDHVIAQSRPADEIIVVDNSTEGLSKALLIKDFPAVKYFGHAGSLGCQPGMRNVAVENCESDILAFTDDDGYADTLWLEELERVYIESSPCAVGGRIIQGEQIIQGVKDRPYCGLFSVIKGPVGNFNIEYPMVFEVEQLQGTNMSFDLRALKRIDGWDRMLESGYASFEELDVCLGVRQQGGKIMFNPKAIVSHGLEPRENGLPRDYGLSSDFTLSSVFNYCYVLLKYGHINNRSLLTIFLIAITFVKRCFFVERRISLSGGRWCSAVAVLKGIRLALKEYSSGR